MSSVIGEARVRIRPDTKTFASETKRGISSGLRSAAGIAGVGLGIAAVVGQIKSATQAAKEAQTIQLQTAAALRAGGDSWEQYGRQIEDAANKQAKLQAFDDEEVVAGFTRIYTNVQDVGKALELTSLAGQVATFKMVNGQRDLGAAAQIVAKVAGGNVSILRRYGISLKDGATASEALAALQEKLAGRAEAFASGAEGATAKLNKVWGDTQEIVGGALLPTITDLSNRLGEYLDHANSTGETQRRVNEVMTATGDAVKGVGEGLDVIRKIAGPVVDALGGVEQAAKLVVEVWAISKVVKFGIAVRGLAASFGFIAASSRATTAKVVADAAVAEAALDAAYRPRTLIVTQGTGPGVPIPGRGPNTKPKPSKGTRLGRFVRKIPGVGGAVAGILGSKALTALSGIGLAAGTVATIEAIVILSSRGASASGGDESKYPFVMALVAKVEAGQPLTKDEVAAVKTLGNKSVTNLSAADLRALNGKLAAAASKGTSAGLRNRPEEGRAAREAQAAANRPTKKAPKRTGPRRLTFKQVEGRIAGFEEQQTDARLKKSTSGERKALTAEEAFLNEQLKDKRRSADQRRSLKAKLESVQGEIERLDTDAASTRRAAADKAAQDRRDASDKRDAALQAQLDRFDSRRREAELAGGTGRKVLAAEEAFLKKQISMTKKGSARRKMLQDELLKVREDVKQIDDAAAKKAATANATTLKGEVKRLDAELRGAGISTAAQITAKITGQDPAKLGVFATGRGPSSSSGSSGGSFDRVATPAVDQLLRDLAVGQAQRDALALREAQETNRLLRIIAPGDQSVPRTRRGRNIDRVTGIEQTRETATVTGGLP